jgi:hypothetical protein
MVTRSYSQHSADSESPVLQMSWISEGGRLRSRWTVAPQPRDVRFAWPESGPQLRVTTERAAIFNVESLFALGVLCCFFALFLL